MSSHWEGPLNMNTDILADTTFSRHSLRHTVEITLQAYLYSTKRVLRYLTGSNRHEIMIGYVHGMKDGLGRAASENSAVNSDVWEHNLQFERFSRGYVIYIVATSAMFFIQLEVCCCFTCRVQISCSFFVDPTKATQSAQLKVFWTSYSTNCDLWRQPSMYFMDQKRKKTDGRHRHSLACPSWRSCKRRCGAGQLRM